ncbi:MAG: PAS domain-containing sensor histidine kinase [Verrucomicrobiota bacterium]|nr:PAS domain-containing sensor histidine kinase [Verrucomicrobiota bacterium]
MAELPVTPEQGTTYVPKCYAQEYSAGILLDALMTYAPDKVYIKDREGRFLALSDNHRGSFNVSQVKEIIGKTDYDFFSKELSDGWRNDEIKVMESRQGISNYCTFHTQNGRNLYSISTKLPWIREDGEVHGIIGVIRDVTEERELEAQAKSYYNFLKALLDNLPDQIYFKDREHRFLLASQSVASIFNVDSPQQLVGHTDADYFPPELVTATHDRENIVMQSGNPITGRLNHKVWPDGSIRWFFANRFPLRNEQGETIGVFGINTEVTDLKKTEEKLTETLELLQALMEYSPDRIYFKDAESRFLRVSNSLAAFCGRETEEVIGKTDFDLFGEAHARTALEDEKRIVTTGQPLLNKIEREVHLDGKVTWSLSTKLPLHDRNGKIIGTFGISKDITEIKLTESRLEETNRQLLETSRMAGRAEVATGVLHNVGNVLNSVNVAATLVEDGLRTSKVGQLTQVADLLDKNQANLASFLTTDPKGKQLPNYIRALGRHLMDERLKLSAEMNDLRRNLEHVREIVTMQQNYARSSAFEIPASVTSLIEDAIKITSSGLARHDVSLIREINEVPMTLIEPNKVLQILVNLISNAKYAMDGNTWGPKVLTVNCVLRDKETVVISIKDTGVGIPRENMKRIFELGFTTRKEGHGFGLHSSAIAAREIGGRIAAESPGPRQGATFILEFPLKPLNTEHVPHS